MYFFGVICIRFPTYFAFLPYLLKETVLRKHSVLIKLLCYYILMQDAHEFLNYLLNELDDILEKEAKTDNETSSSPGKISNGPKLLQANGVHKEPTVTWVHKIFQVTSSSFWLHYYTRVKLNRVPKPNQIIKWSQGVLACANYICILLAQSLNFLSSHKTWSKP